MLEIAVFFEMDLQLFQFPNVYTLAPTSCGTYLKISTTIGRMNRQRSCTFWS
ncbi:MAG: hypothetical protein K0Q63_810 [Paenibacillus sp.]|jgi:hypothetical protein|nr:hypothetical protein [Paenibacillus sp.]